MLAEEEFIKCAENKVKKGIKISLNEYNYLMAIYYGIDKKMCDKIKECFKK